MTDRAIKEDAVDSADWRQSVVIACGGGKVGVKSGEVYAAFALPG